MCSESGVERSATERERNTARNATVVYGLVEGGGFVVERGSVADERNEGDATRNGHRALRRKEQMPLMSEQDEIELAIVTNSEQDEAVFLECVRLGASPGLPPRDDQGDAGFDSPF